MYRKGAGHHDQGQPTVPIGVTEHEGYHRLADQRERDRRNEHGRRQYEGRTARQHLQSSNVPTRVQLRRVRHNDQVNERHRKPDKNGDSSATRKIPTSCSCASAPNMRTAYWPSTGTQELRPGHRRGARRPRAPSGDRFGALELQGRLPAHAPEAKPERHEAAIVRIAMAPAASRRAETAIMTNKRIAKIAG